MYKKLRDILDKTLLDDTTIERLVSIYTYQFPKLGNLSRGKYNQNAYYWMNEYCSDPTASLDNLKANRIRVDKRRASCGTPTKT